MVSVPLSVQVVVSLLKNNANVNAQNGDGHTALMFAYNGRNQVASLLDKYSEYVKKETEDNSTAIIQKALETHSSIVDTLLANGADEAIKDKKGNVAVDFDYKKKEPKEVGAEGEGAKALGEGDGSEGAAGAAAGKSEL